MNVGLKSNDSSLIFSGHLHFGLLPVCLLAPDIIFYAIDIVYIFFQIFHFIYIMFVFFTSAVWPALNTTTIQYGGYKLPLCNSQLLCCFICPNILRRPLSDDDLCDSPNALRLFVRICDMNPLTWGY